MYLRIISVDPKRVSQTRLARESETIGVLVINFVAALKICVKKIECSEPDLAWLCLIHSGTTPLIVNIGLRRVEPE